MKNLIKRIIFNKLYIGCLVIVFIQYIIRINYVKQSLFTTTISTISEYSLLILAILGSTFLAGTILFIAIYAFILVFKKFILPIWKKLFSFLRK